MQTKFIAGPWQVFHDHPDADTAKSVATIRPVGPDRSERHICNVYLCNYPGETGERMTATAALIAAAPTLLDALAEATDALSGGLWDYGPGQTEHERCNEVVARCRAALAAAIEYTPAQEVA